MYIVVGNRRIKLDSKETKAAKKIAANVLHQVRQTASEKKAPTFYLTFLIVMHIMTGDLIELLTPDSLKKITDH